MLKGIIMDLDGTLLDSMQIWETVGERFLASVGKTARSGFRETVYPMTLEESARYMKREYGLTLSESEIRRQVLAILQHFYAQEVSLKPGAMALLDAIWRLQLPMAAATSSDRGQMLEAFRRLGIADRFAEIFTCANVGEGKHAPNIYYRAAEFLAGSPEYKAAEFLVFEDALYCLETAKAAGFRTCGVYDAANALQWPQIQKTADEVLTGREDESRILALLKKL